MSDTDLSRIVGLIMENPKLIEEIKNLSSKANSTEESKSNEEETSLEESAKSEAEPLIAATENTNRVRRRELLSALKPYVSEGRGKAIDSVMSIVDILDMMRSN